MGLGSKSYGKVEGLRLTVSNRMRVDSGNVSSHV